MPQPPDARVPLALPVRVNAYIDERSSDQLGNSTGVASATHRARRTAGRASSGHTKMWQPTRLGHETLVPVSFTTLRGRSLSCPARSGAAGRIASHVLKQAGRRGSTSGWLGVNGEPLVVAAANAPSSKADSPGRPRASSRARTTLEEKLALATAWLGYRAAYCPKVALDDKDRIRDIAQPAFAKHDVDSGRGWPLAATLVDPDLAKRRPIVKTGHRRSGLGRSDRRSAAAWTAGIAGRDPTAGSEDRTRRTFPALFSTPWWRTPASSSTP